MEIFLYTYQGCQLKFAGFTHRCRQRYVYISRIWHPCHIFLWTITFKNTLSHSAKIIASYLFTSVNISSFVPSKSHLRHSQLFSFHQKQKAVESHRLLVETYGEHAPVIRTCQTLFRQFKSGDFDLRCQYTLEF